MFGTVAVKAFPAVRRAGDVRPRARQHDDALRPPPPRRRRRAAAGRGVQGRFCAPVCVPNSGHRGQLRATKRH
jgi:hypothetical protein